jgi:hypothetical protein
VCAASFEALLEVLAPGGGEAALVEANLYSLLASCLKCCCLAAQDTSSSSSSRDAAGSGEFGALQARLRGALAALLASAVCKSAGCALRREWPSGLRPFAAASTTRSSSGGGSMCSLTHWWVLLARCLRAHPHAAGTSDRVRPISDLWAALAAHAHAAGGDDHSGSSSSSSSSSSGGGSSSSSVVRGAGSVPQLLRDLARAASEQARPQDESVRQLQLQLADAIVTALPLPSLCCNNPGCCNVSALSDMHLVAGKGLCAHCGGAARSCSKECRREHWKAHKDRTAWLWPLP